MKKTLIAGKCVILQKNKNNKKRREMKKLMLLMAAVATMAFASCGGDDDESTLSKEFVGEYTVSTTVHMTNIPMVGDYDQTIPEMDASIVSTGGEEVSVTMGGKTTTGYVTSSGLHVDPIVVSQTFLNMAMDVQFTFPVIKAPVDGKTSWTSNLSASVSGVGISGTADMVAVKK